MSPTGISGTVSYQREAEEVGVVIENEEKLFYTEDPERTVLVIDNGIQTEIEDMRGNSGQKYILEAGQSLKIKPGMFDGDKIKLNITHYRKES